MDEAVMLEAGRMPAGLVQRAGGSAELVDTTLPVRSEQDRYRW